MKVGVYIGVDGPEAGGGNSFVRAVLAGLEATQSRHTFQVLHGNFGVAEPEPSPTLARKIRNRVEGDAEIRARRERDLAAHVRSLRLDLLWFLTPTTPAVLPTPLPYVVTVWDIAHRVEPAFPEVRSTGWTWENREAHYRKWLPPAAYVVVGASALGEDLSRCYGISPRRIRVLPLVSPTHEAGVSRPVRGKPYLFYPAQFWPHKNHVGLLLALKEVRETHGLDLDLVLCGSDKGNLSYISETVGALGLQSSVKILGFVPDDELTALYQGAVAMVFPSFFGPDNLPPLEAMQLGCPVIAADVPGAREQLGDAALLVDPRNTTDIAAAIARLVRDSQLRDTLVARGRERVARWQPADYAAGIVRILDEFETERRCWSSTTEYVHT